MEYYESKVHGTVCEKAFGIDLKQNGMMTMAELDLLLEKSEFGEGQSILEIGSGAGQIANYISQKTSAKFLCVDVDEKAVAWASAAHRENTKLSFRVLDVRNISKLTGKFNKIIAIDSLYFVSGKRIDTFYESLKAVLRDLHELLEDDGELAIFWSELPFFKLSDTSPECTQIGICLKELGYPYVSYDLTENEAVFWKTFKDTLIDHEQDYEREGSKDLYDSNLQEADFFQKRAKEGLLYRNLYLIRK